MGRAGFAILLAALLALIGAGVVVGFKRNDPARKVWDESLVGLIGVFFLLPQVFPRLKTVSIVGEVVLIALLIWRMWQQIRERRTRRPP